MNETHGRGMKVFILTSSYCDRAGSDTMVREQQGSGAMVRELLRSMAMGQRRVTEEDETVAWCSA